MTALKIMLMIIAAGIWLMLLWLFVQGRFPATGDHFVDPPHSKDNEDSP